MCDTQTVEFLSKQTDTIKGTSINYLKSLTISLEQK